MCWFRPGVAVALDSSRFNHPIYLFHHTHVGLLLREALGDGAETDYLADVLLAPLAADAFIYQREACGTSVSELTDSWTALATALVTGWPPNVVE